MPRQGQLKPLPPRVISSTNYVRCTCVRRSHHLERVMGAVKFGTNVGDAMGLTMGWGFNKEADRHRAESHIDRTEPSVLMCSPPCVALSQPQSLIFEIDVTAKQLDACIRRIECVGKPYRKPVEGWARIVHHKPSHLQPWAPPGIKHMNWETIWSRPTNVILASIHWANPAPS